MDKDFSLRTHKKLLDTLSDQGFSFLTFEEFVSGKEGKVVVLRHDVDKSPENSLEIARDQAQKGIRGTYYFRIVQESFNEKIIKEIYLLGHEIGYHYEDVSMATGDRRQATGRHSASTLQLFNSSTDEKELIKIAIESFKKNLDLLRRIAPVKTICMHGSPMSRWDSRLLWKYYDYHDFGIVGEPYFDIDFDQVLYLTDTGRRWDGDSFNIRDKVKGLNNLGTKGFRDEEKSLSLSVSSPAPRTPHLVPFPKFHSTFDIIKAAEQGKLPDKIMMTFHPQRWTDKPLPWIKELIWQNVKNAGKYFLVKIR